MGKRKLAKYQYEKKGRRRNPSRMSYTLSLNLIHYLLGCQEHCSVISQDKMNYNNIFEHIKYITLGEKK